MPRAPVTRDQVDAYRFGLRRLEAALMRGDPVPLHEQIRSQRRAAMAGVLLGLLALAGVAVYALVVPRPAWFRQALVVGDSSGAMYAVAHDPDRLVPVANLAAGRLVLAALGAGGSGAGPATPVVVPDDDLARAPLTATAAVPGAVAVHAEGPGIAPRWAVCDEVGAAGRPRLVGTTVVGGTGEPAPGAPADTGVLLAVPGGDTYVVVDGKRHRVDPDDRPVLAALGLAGRTPRPASPGLVSGIPEGSPLATPVLRPGRAPAGVPGDIGDVVTTTAAGGATRSFVVLAGGLQEIPVLAAQVLTAAGGTGPVAAGPGVVAATPLLDELDLTGWPVGPARWAEPADAPVVCWTWAAGADSAVSVLVGDRPPAPADAVPVVLAQGDGPGERADTVVLAPGGGGPVRATVPGQSAGTGPLWLVSATGVGYGVPDDASAAALGITRSDPAPEAALRLLPTGPALDVAAAARVIDVVDPAGAGGG
ncbi:type VII secretion protein EccB [Pseudonocardia sp. H11422]|uniref:type VII secretion protein EccB n=1 Tax=Pseudonocardia sp. H11422 TaxID=2835866 RepID=UPI001BDD726D|nr:type VII secretion protein EccB [Pseudonocardia sp. H11422]